MRLRAEIVLATSVLCGLSMAWGCRGGDPLGRKAVSGKVTLDGAPVEHGSINFQPIEGKTSSGAMITNGSYSIPRDKGLPAGKYLVMINASKPGAPLPPGAMPGDDTGPQPEELIPADWNTKSKNTIEVKESGPFEFNFDVQTQKK